MRLLATFLSLLLSAGAASTGEVRAIETPAPVQRIEVAGDAAFLKTVAGSVFRLKACPDRLICLDPAAAMPERAKPPAGGLPDGSTATATSGDIVRAWYTRPTGRYGHGVLGDATEAGGLKVETQSGEELEFVLPDTHVFEDLTPRIADIDGDGTNEVVTIRSSLIRGAAVAVYGLRDGALRQLDVAPEIGRSSRWLNIAGIAKYWGSDAPLIVWVETPHIRGTLRMARFRDGRLEVLPDETRGFSNHVIGSRELGLSATGDLDGDNIEDLVLPTADRRGMVVLTARGSDIIPLPGAVAHRIVIVSDIVVSATENGNLLAIVPEPDR
ncbi:hypothetical protein [Aquibium oceanicum]|uniref:FG-GAP repeat protein n=1 Tax=Aquibium oceanicum TaxID=1670800 RepID=A0A1L3SP66_9HYPH|nr:hypothetical protein [Aquibium oceanicum]APH71196.1 hypothetical protein BSQ44_07270 [Aquibium oceanicum]